MLQFTNTHIEDIHVGHVYEIVQPNCNESHLAIGLLVDVNIVVHAQFAMTDITGEYRSHHSRELMIDDMRLSFITQFGTGEDMDTGSIEEQLTSQDGKGRIAAQELWYQICAVPEYPGRACLSPGRLETYKLVGSSAIIKPTFYCGEWLLQPNSTVDGYPHVECDHVWEMFMRERICAYKAQTAFPKFSRSLYGQSFLPPPQVRSVGAWLQHCGQHLTDNYADSLYQFLENYEQELQREETIRVEQMRRSSGPFGDPLYRAPKGHNTYLTNKSIASGF